MYEIGISGIYVFVFKNNLKNPDYNLIMFIVHIDLLLAL